MRDFDSSKNVTAIYWKQTVAIFLLVKRLINNNNLNK